MRTRWTRLKDNWDSQDRAIQAKIEETVDRIEVTLTQCTVEQIQAQLRAAAAEQRLAEYTTALMHRPVDELSADLIQSRRRPA